VRAAAAGFTLLELLIVVFIVSVLAMFAVPAYYDYATRARLAEGIYQIGPLKQAVAETYILSGAWPTSNADAGLPDASAYASSVLEGISVADDPAPGAIVIRYDEAKVPEVRGTNTLIFIPSQGGRTILWTCTAGTLPNNLRPAECRS